MAWGHRGVAPDERGRIFDHVCPIGLKQHVDDISHGFEQYHRLMRDIYERTKVYGNHFLTSTNAAKFIEAERREEIIPSRDR